MTDENINYLNDSYEEITNGLDKFSIDHKFLPHLSLIVRRSYY
jgi:hypothetical protein